MTTERNPSQFAERTQSHTYPTQKLYSRPAFETDLDQLEQATRVSPSQVSSLTEVMEDVRKRTDAIIELSRESINHHQLTILDMERIQRTIGGGSR